MPDQRADADVPPEPPEPSDPSARFEADLPEGALRARGVAKWAMAPAGVLPAWVAEMDVSTCRPVVDAVRAAVDRDALGYPPTDDATAVPQAFSAFAARRFGWHVDPGRVVLAGDVMSGIRLVLETLCEDAPVVVPTPAYTPFLDVVPLTGRRLVQVPCPVVAGAATLDLDAVDAALAAGGRTVLLSNPHNPLGRAYRLPELAALRDVVARHGARVVVDEVHAPLVLPGATHLPFAALDGAAELTTTVTSASKAWNVPALKCAQVVVGSDADLARLRALPLVANHGLSLLGAVANVAAYTHGAPWLDALLAHLDRMRRLWAARVAEHLPDAATLPLEATYLAWLDLRAYGHEQPAALLRSRGQVLVNEGAAFGDGGAGHVRVNLATSATRVEQLVTRMAAALTT